MTDDPPTWACEAYGDDGLAFGALCFVGGGPGLRTCAHLDECREVMAGQRRGVFRRINELAAQGDETGIYLAGEFTHPDQLLDADRAEDSDDR